MLRNRAVRGGGRLRVSPAIHLRAAAEAGPLARTTATPHLPWPDDNAKMLSASASPAGSPSQVDRDLQGGVPLLEIGKRLDTLSLSLICGLSLFVTVHRHAIHRNTETHLYVLEPQN